MSETRDRDEHSLQYSSRPLDAAKSPSLGLQLEQSMVRSHLFLVHVVVSRDDDPLLDPSFRIPSLHRLQHTTTLPSTAAFEPASSHRRTHFTPSFTQNSAAIKSGAIHRFGPTFVTWVVAEVTFSAMRMGEPADSLPRLLTCTWGRRGREREEEKTRVWRKLLQIHKYMQILRAKSYLRK